MKKSDLKTGMILELASGERAMVYLGTETGDVVSGDTWYPLHEGVDEDLKATSDTYSDVVKVLQPLGDIGYKYDLHSINHKVVWERPEEITYRVGQRFTRGGQELLLCMVDNYKGALIDMCAGCRLLNPVTIQNPLCVTQGELDKMYIKNVGEIKLKETEG